jgi:twinkle protein
MTEHRDESSFVGHEPCLKCGSRDNLARYASGRGHCHGCGHNDFPDDYEGNRTHTPPSRNTSMTKYEPMQGDLGDESFTKAYGISTKVRKETGMSLVRYAVTHLEVEYPIKPCVTFDYRLPDGTMWGQKVRYKLPEGCPDGEKTYRFPHAKGSPLAPMYLMHKWSKGSDRRSLCIFEGEGDCNAYYQVSGGKFPVVSLPNGAKGAEDTLRGWYEWIDEFDKIVLIFDGDETGREWSTRTAALLPPGKAFIGEVPGFKDARSALLAGDSKAIQQAYFNATEFRPEGIFMVKDLIAEARKPIVMGMPWWSETLTKWTFGRRPGELYTLGAGNSIGKTDWTTQSIAYDAMVLKVMTAVIYLEQPPVETLKRLAGKIAGKPFHIPMEEGGYTQLDLDKALDGLELCDKLIFGGNFSTTEWPEVAAKIRYLVVSKGVKIVYLDNLTALVDTENERQSVETIIKQMALLCQDLQINIVLLCHLKDVGNSGGASHEEGGKVRLNQFKGSRAMGAWPHYAFGLERDTQHENPALRNYSTFRVVKDRYTGRANGNTMCLRFDTATGQLNECEFPQDDSAKSGGFTAYDPDSPLNI